MAKISLRIKGMHCRSCKMLVEEALQDTGARDISITIDEKKQIGTASFFHNDTAKAKEAIQKEGYQVM